MLDAFITALKLAEHDQRDLLFECDKHAKAEDISEGTREMRRMRADAVRNRLDMTRALLSMVLPTNPYRGWGGQYRYGPGLEEGVVNVVRRGGSQAKEWRRTESHHIDWRHTGGPEDVLMYQVSQGTAEEELWGHPPVPRDDIIEEVAKMLDGYSVNGAEWARRVRAMKDIG